MSVAGLQRSMTEGALVGWLMERPPSVARLPVGVLTAGEVAVELQRVQQRKAMDAAYEAELVMALAAARPDTDDPPPGHPGARRRGGGSPVPGTSEFFPDELGMVLNCSRSFASRTAAQAYQLVERMPAVHAECTAGRLDRYRAGVFADVLGSASDEVVAAVVPAVLPLAAGLSPGKLRNRLVAAAQAADEAFAEQRRIEAQERAAVRLYPTSDGMSVLASELPAPVAAAMWSTIDQAAQLAATGGDDRPIGVLRAEAHAALVLEPGDPTRPAMTGHLTVVAPLAALHPSTQGNPPDPVARAAAGVATPAKPDDLARPPDLARPADLARSPGVADPADPADRAERAAAGEATPAVNGTPITAAHLRELLAQLGAVGVQAPPGGSLTVALTDDDGALLATATAAELARLDARGCPDHGGDAHGRADHGGDAHGRADRDGDAHRRADRDGDAHRRADCDGAADQVSAGDCGCSVLGKPAEAPGYEATAAQQRFIRLATAPAGTPAAANQPDAPTQTTSSPTTAADAPPARTSAACAAPITGSRPLPAAGASRCAPTARSA